MFLWYSFSQNTFATNIEIIPKADLSDEQAWNMVDCVAGKGGWECEIWTVWSRYNKKLNSEPNEIDIGSQFKTWIFSWNSIKLYAWYIIRFLLQMALLIGAVMIIVAGYKYATAVYKWSDPWKKDILNAIVGVLIVISSFAIIKILQTATGIWE